MSLLVPLSETTFTDASNVSDINQDEDNKSENEKNINIDDESNDNSDNGDMEKILIETEKNLEKIMQINSETFDKLANKLQLSSLKQFKQFKQLKQSSEKFKIDNTTTTNNNNNNNNTTNNEDTSKEKDIMKYNEHKSNAVNGFTGVSSSIAGSLSIVDSKDEQDKNSESHDLKSFSMTDMYIDYVKEYHEIPSFEQFKQHAYKEAKHIFSNPPNLPQSLKTLLVQEKEKKHERHMYKSGAATDAASTAQVDEHEFTKIHSSKVLHAPLTTPSSGVMQDEKEKEHENGNNLIVKDCNNDLRVDEANNETKDESS